MSKTIESTTSSVLDGAADTRPSSLQTGPVTNLRALPARDLVELVRAAATTRPGFITTVVDGGAGIGDTAQPLLGASAEVHVYAYEPVAENVAVLEQRFDEEPRVTVRPVAISDRAGTARFEVPSRVDDQQGAWAAGTSYNGHLERTGFIGNVRRIARDLRKRLRRQPVDVLVVPTVRLDEDLDQVPDVVKLDLQGAEPAALAGLGDRFADVKVFQVELQLLHARDTHVFDLLTSAGFTAYVSDLQFAAAALTDNVRAQLHDAGVRIEKEFTGTTFNAHTMVLGHWATDAGLPVRGQGLTEEFGRLLEVAQVEYFQTDVVALTGRVDWSDVLDAAAAAKS